MHVVVISTQFIGAGIRFVGYGPKPDCLWQFRNDVWDDETLVRGRPLNAWSTSILCVDEESPMYCKCKLIKQFIDSCLSAGWVVTPTNSCHLQKLYTSLHANCLMAS